MLASCKSKGNYLLSVIWFDVLCEFALSSTPHPLLLLLCECDEHTFSVVKLSFSPLFPLSRFPFFLIGSHLPVDPLWSVWVSKTLSDRIENVATAAAATVFISVADWRPLCIDHVARRLFRFLFLSFSLCVLIGQMIDRFDRELLNSDACLPN